MMSSNRMTCCLAVVLVAFAATQASAQRENRGPQVPDSIEARRDIAYAGTDHERQTLDLFLPKNRKTDRPLPVIAFIHGGAWRGGDKRGGFGWLRPYVESGQYAGVSVGYRLSQHAQWPAQIHDCKAATRWIRAHAKEHGLDPERVGVIGTSAGGHLVALLGTTGGVAELEGHLGKHTDESSQVTCVVNYFGPSDFRTIADHPSRLDHAADDSPEALLIGGAIEDRPERARAASPVVYVSADDPPFLIVHGTEDMIVPYKQSERLRDALREEGVEVALVSVEGGGHGGFQSDVLTERVRAFFGKHLRGQEAEFEDETVR